MDYGTLIKKVQKIKNSWQVETLCKTKFNRDVLVFKRIVDPNLLYAIIVASVHARENITTDLVMKMIEDGLFEDIQNFNVIVVPMLNPDGVELVQNGITSAPENERERLIKINGGSLDFSLWKSNGNGVDLNNNFDAKFGTNIGSNNPAPSGFAGEFFESEPESKALVEFSKNVSLFISVSFHSKGEEIYFNFFQNERNLKRDKMIAEKFAESTTYSIKNPEMVSSGGFKDWCVYKLKIPALTIEVGSDTLTHPIGAEHLNEIFEKNKNIANDIKFAYNVFKN